MKNTKIFLIAALLGTTLVACQKEQDNKTPEQPVLKKTVTLTVQATKNVDTKAMHVDGNTLTAFWSDDEEVAVYVAGSAEPQGTLIVSNANTVGSTSTAALTGAVDVTYLTDGSNTLTLLFPGRADKAWTYEGQDGTAPDGNMASLFDYAMTTLTVSYDEENGTITPSGPASFENQQSIFRFGFNMAMSSFTITSEKNELVVSRSFEDGNWVSTHGPMVVNPGSTEATTYYVSIRNEYTSNEVADRLYFSYIGTGNAFYEGSQKIGTSHLGNEKFLGATVTMAQKTLAPSTDPEAPTISQEEDVL